MWSCSNGNTLNTIDLHTCMRSLFIFCIIYIYISWKYVIYQPDQYPQPITIFCACDIIVVAVFLNLNRYGLCAKDRDMLGTRICLIHYILPNDPIIVWPYMTHIFLHVAILHGAKRCPQILVNICVSLTSLQHTVLSPGLGNIGAYTLYITRLDTNFTTHIYADGNIEVVLLWWS